MGLTQILMKNPYPLSLYHKDHDKPIRVDNKGQEDELTVQGWTRKYIRKEYPKAVYDPHYPVSVTCPKKTAYNEEQEKQIIVEFKESHKRPILDKAVEIAKEHQSGEADTNATPENDGVDIPADPEDKPEREIEVTKVIQVDGEENPEPVGDKPEEKKGPDRGEDGRFKKT